VIKINNSFKILILIVILISSFLFGYISSRHQNFLYHKIEKIYDFIKFQKPIIAEENSNVIENILDSNEFVDYQKSYIENIYNLVKYNSKLLRNDLINKIILPKEIVKLNKNELIDIYNFKKFFPNNKKNKFVLKVKFYEIENFGILEKENNKKLFVFIGGQGISKIPLEYEKFIELKKRIKNKGYDILSLSLAGIGYNIHKNNISFPSNPNIKKINLFENYTKKIDQKSFKHIVTGNTKYLRHIWLPFFDENYPELFPISLILSGNYYIIKELENDYDEIVMVGLSGGGWASTMLSSLIPKVKYSYSFAGSIPKPFSPPNLLPHDLMGGESSFWQVYDLWHLYLLALFDENGLQNRYHNLIFGEDDICCFYPPYTTSFYKFNKKFPIKGFSVDILENLDHNIDNKFLLKKIN